MAPCRPLKSSKRPHRYTIPEQMCDIILCTDLKMMQIERERERAAREWECVLTWMHAYKHLVMIPDDGNFPKEIEWPCRPANAPRRRKRAETGTVQKSPHRPPSHWTSTKPSGGRGVTGAKTTPRAEQGSERKKTMFWRNGIYPMKRKSMLFIPCNKLFW